MAKTQFECPTGTTDESYLPVLASTNLYDKAPVRLSAATQRQMLAVLPGRPSAVGVSAVHGEPPITKQAYHTTAGSNADPTRVVMHTAECPCKPGAATGIGNYFATSAAGGSAHYGVDPDAEGHYVHEAVIAWHAPPNAHSLGIEIAGYAKFTPTDWQDPEVEKALHRAAARAADLCHRYGIPIVWLSPNDLLAGKRGITGHVCVTEAWHQSTHTDPGPDFPVHRFLSYVNFYLGAAPAPTPPKANRTLVRRIQRAVHAPTVDGHWDAALDRHCGRVRDTHPASGKKAIKVVQKQLDIKVDGIWGPQTDAAVHKAIQGIQAALGVPDDGVWGGETQNAYRAARRANYGK